MTIGQRCASCERPSTTVVRIERGGPDSVAWTAPFCEAHGVKVMEMVTGYQADEAIKHRLGTAERFGRDEEGGR